MRRALLLVALAVLTSVAPAASQSLFATRGLGVPIAPVGARARILGGIGVGLLGFNASLASPATIAGAAGPGGVVTVQPSSRTIRFEGVEAETAATRFPLIRVLYPVSDRLVASAGYGAFLDQTFNIVSEGTELIGGEPVRVRDAIESDGGIAQLHLGAAYSLTPELVLAAAGGFYTGDQEVRIRRTFRDTSSNIPLEPFRSRSRRSYSAPLAVVGVRWDPLEVVRVGASVTWAGRLDVEIERTGEEEALGGVPRSFDLPLQVAVGTSALLAPDLLAAVSARWAGWGAAADDFREPIARDAWKVGGGLEWQGIEWDGRTFPIRIGGQYGRLPFEIQGEAPTTWSVGLGLGAVLARTETGLYATANATIERGARGDTSVTGLAEDFWRVTISLALFGQ